MPLYEYKCSACDHQFEALQKISEEPLKHCPACEEPQLRKLVSAAGFRLKGDGWYETDFKSGQKRNLAESDTGSSAKNPNAA
jgi:putative FmdB family regulatory protein